MERPPVVAVALAAVGMPGGVLKASLHTINLKAKPKDAVEEFFGIRRHDRQPALKHLKGTAFGDGRARQVADGGERCCVWHKQPSLGPQLSGKGMKVTGADWIRAAEFS